MRHGWKGTKAGGYIEKHHPDCRGTGRASIEETPEPALAFVKELRHDADAMTRNAEKLESGEREAVSVFAVFTGRWEPEGAQDSEEWAKKIEATRRIGAGEIPGVEGRFFFDTEQRLHGFYKNGLWQHVKQQRKVINASMLLRKERDEAGHVPGLAVPFFEHEKNSRIRELKAKASAARAHARDIEAAAAQEQARA